MNDIVVKEEQRGYSIHVEPLHRLITCKLYGFFDSRFERQYHDDFFRVLASLHVPEVFLLVDTTEYPPQSKEVQEIRQRIIHKLAEYHVTKLAYVAAKALNRLQSERLAKQKSEVKIAFFKSEEEARAWLLK
ncbi:hypothetical protein U27_04602 [Candidatus Vecturithrix granuli]|uniref:STAS/SEC14 domain-containing protein n=1 Tax=Vecturithrix granuli TaxID=1499967 RepID=A0A081BZ80_VECG1|nr:hypothetical protein U27_04602 [Candidatus Vecturithrix granuli]